jgi:hypothetical protein
MRAAHSPLVSSRPRLLSLLALLCCAAALLACEPDPTPSTWQPQAQTSADGEGVDTDPDAAVDPDGSVYDLTDLSGTWVRATDWSTCVKVLGRFDESRIFTLTRVEIAQDNYRLSEVHEICQVRSTPVAGLETLIPKAAIDSGNPIYVESTLFGSGEGAIYASGLQIQLWGMRMDDPVADLLPTRDTLPDPRIFDADDDGAPGVTFTVGGDFCFMRTVQRTLSTIYGTLQPDGRILGQSSVVSEQFLIEATNAFCDTSWEVRANDDFNNIVMVRVDSGGLDLDSDGDGVVSCDEIIAAQERIILWSDVDKNRCKR